MATNRSEPFHRRTPVPMRGEWLCPPERGVPSGLAALLFGSVPLWTSLIDWLWGGRLKRVEVVGLFFGFAGVLLVSLRGALRAEPLGALIVLGSAASYALGAVSTRRL